MAPDFKQAIDAAVTEAVATAFRVLQENIIDNDAGAQAKFTAALDSIQKAMNVAEAVVAARQPGEKP